MITLDLMSENDFRAYEGHALNDYSRDGQEGTWPNRAIAQKQFATAFPDGLQTKGFEFLAIRTEFTVGSLVIKTMDRPTGREAFIMDIVIESKHRRQGYATKALEILSTWTANKNFDQISLSVMSSNPQAARLYEKAGFLPVFTRMTKSIKAEPVRPATVAG